MTPGNEVVSRRDTCRLCGSRELDEVLSLVPTPPANAFVTEAEKNTAQECFPLDIFLCRDCSHLQLLDVVNPALLFEDYVYVSGTSPAFVEHFRTYARETISRNGLEPDDFVFEIGSNDGTLLQFYKEAGMRILGVDPAREIANSACRKGLETIAGFFTSQLAEKILSERGPASLIVANNVFAHSDDLQGITEGVRRLLAARGVFVFEVSYLGDVYEKLLFDTIYHEHLAYHSVGPLRSFFPRNGMELIDAIRVDTHGGSLRCVVQKDGGGREVSSRVDQLISKEKELGLDRSDTFREFARRIDGFKLELGEILKRIKREGKLIAGFGAPAKATTLMHHFEVGLEVIDFIVDDSPLKQGLYTPGFHIPVLPVSAVYDRRPDYLLVLAWNFAEQIMAKLKSFSEAGGRFIVPIPELRVI